MATWWFDEGNTYSIENGELTSLSIGKDTIVSLRNTILGVIPESNVDAAVSFSQLKYDLERIEGRKTGGSIELLGSKGWSTTGIQEFRRKLFDDWW